MSLLNYEVHLKFQINACFNDIHWNRVQSFDQHNLLRRYPHFNIKRIDLSFSSLHWNVKQPK